MQAPKLIVENLTKKFGGLSAVNNLSFKLHEGEILGLIGPNGAGKTTTFNLITGFIRPDKGKVVYEGVDIGRIKPHEICGLGMTRTFQLAKPMYGMTVIENVLVGALNKKELCKRGINSIAGSFGFSGFNKIQNRKR